MALVDGDLVVTLEQRLLMLDQIDQAIADLRRLLPPKQKRRRRQLRLPLAPPAKSPTNPPDLACFLRGSPNDHAPPPRHGQPRYPRKRTSTAVQRKLIPDRD
jgi:hypothetical protein